MPTRLSLAARLTAMRGGGSYLRNKRRRTCCQIRNGAASVEFAIVGPIVFLTILASIQFSSLAMSQNALTAAAREGGRVASMTSTVSKDPVNSAVEARLRRSGINPALVTIDVDPDSSSALASLQSGDEVRVSVTGPLRDMSWIGAFTLPNANLAAEITYVRE